MMWVMWNLVFVHLDIVLVLVQHRGTVWTNLIVLLCEEAPVDARFS
jgi:hypothetical protein